MNPLEEFDKSFDGIRLEFLKSKTPEQLLRELLAHIHGDGGHHTDKVGLAKSVLDAERKL